MTFPNVQLDNPWVRGEEVDEVKLWDRVTDKLNKIAASAPLGQLGSAYDTTVQTALTTAGTGVAAYYPCGGPVVFSLASQRRVQAFCRVTISPAGATAARYALHCVYAVGSTPLAQGQTPLYFTAYPFGIYNAMTGPASLINQGDAVLAAGVYVAYPLVARYAGGVATDAIFNSYTAVYDQGSA